MASVSSSASVIALGAANVDLAAHAALPLRAGDSTPGRVLWAPGGVARNVAARLAALQPSRAVQLISTVGDDDWGRQLRAATRAAGVNVSAVRALKGLPTSIYVSLHGPDGEMLAAVNAMAVQDRLGPDLLRRHKAALRRASVWFIDANLGGDALAWLLQLRTAGPAAADVPVFADAVSVAKCGRLRPWLPALHSLKVNADEAGELAGRPVRDLAEARAAGAVLLDRGPRQVALSLGALGLLLLRRARDGTARCLHQPALPAAVRSVTGAGDAMMAGLLHAHLRRWPAARAAAFAVASACCALEAPGGAAAPGEREVWQRWRRGSIPPETP